MSKTLSARNSWCPGSTWFQICPGLIFALLLTPQAAQAAANVATPASTQSVDFGTFAVLPTCSNCSITMSAAGARTASAGVVLSSNNVGKPGKFTVTCNNGSCAYTPTVAGSATIAAGGVNMTVGTFTFSKSPTNTTSTLSVGAKLTILTSGSTAGTYSSTSYTLATASP